MPKSQRRVFLPVNVIEKAVFTVKVFVGSQPRRGMQEIIPEYKEVITEENCSLEDMDAAARAISNKALKVEIRGHKVGEGTKVLSTGGSRMEEEGGLKITLGKQWTHEEFTKQALTCKHPFDREISVPARVAEALHAQARLGKQGIEDLRKEAPSYYRKRMKELEPEEKKVHDKLNKDVGKPLRRRIFCFQGNASRRRVRRHESS